MTAIVPEYDWPASRLSPAMTRVRSDGVAPQRFIQRRIGTQYRIENVRITANVGIMRSSCFLHSRGHSINATARSIAKEIGDRVPDNPRLTEHEVSSRLEAGESRARDAFGGALAGFVRREPIVLRMDDQGGHVNGL